MLSLLYFFDYLKITFGRDNFGKVGGCGSISDKKVFDKDLFIYMGSSYTQVFLFWYKTIYEVKNNKTIDIGNEIKVYGETYDEKIGGKDLIKKYMK